MSDVDDEERLRALQADLDDLEHEMRTDRDPSGYYAALGISIHATPQQIRQAFLNLSRSYHTDKHAGQLVELQDAMTRRFQLLQEAYTILSDERKRAGYDASGDVGLRRLDLIPVGIDKREEVLETMRYLEREAKLARLGNLLLSHSDTSIQFSVAHLFALGRAAEQQRRPPTVESAARVSEHADSSAGAPSVEPPDEKDTSRAEVSSPLNEPTSEPEAAATTGTDGAVPQPQPAITMGGKGAHLNATAAEVSINGVPTMVLIPSQEIQDQIRGQLGAARAAQGQPRGAVQHDAAGRQLTFIRGLVVAAVPKSISIQHGFQHSITPALMMRLRFIASDSRERRRGLTASVGVLLEYQRSVTQSIAFALRLSVHNVKATLLHTRNLSPIWALRAKLVCVKGLQLLSNFELKLTRQLSRFATLENALGMSLMDNGYFKTAILRTDGNSHLSLATYISPRALNVVLLRTSACEYATLSGSPHPRKGSFYQSLTLDPLSGQTHVSYDFWLYESKVQHFGIRLSSVVPYTLSPFAFPFFVAMSSQYAVVNQLSLLYARGRHRIAIPIVINISPRLTSAVMWLSAPIMMYRIAALAWEPLRRHRLARWCNEERLKHLAELDVERVRALNEQMAIEPSVMRLRAEEELIIGGGLVIINAKYGVLNPIYSLSPKVRGATLATGRSGDVTNRDSDEVRSEDISLTLDVTVALQSLVHDSKLMLPEGTKSRLIGFYDPDPYTPEKKQLTITYWFQRTKHYAVFNDADAVELPQMAHITLTPPSTGK